MNPLSNAEIVDVAGELLKGFGQEYQLEQLAAKAADINIALEIGKGLPLKKTAYELIQLTEGAGTTELVLREAVFQRPNNKFIQALAARFGLAPAPMSNVRVFAQGSASVVAPPDIGAYEAILLEHAGTAKPGEWRRTMAVREAGVCQILYKGDAIGTGFLVAPDLVMSNWHVFEYPHDGGALGALADYAVRFDYRAAEGEQAASLGKVVAIDAAPGYRAQSPKTAFDYVVVQLVARAGDDPVSAKTQRGWLRPSSRTLEKFESVLVLQHPKARTLELAIGPVMGWVAEREDEVYMHMANTDEGSSGSPCFTAQWELAALHHRADPAGGKQPNRAISMAAVLQDMGGTGTLGLIPELD